MRAVRTRAKGAVLLALFALLSMVIPFSATAGEAPGVKLELAPKVVMYDDSVTATLTPIGFTPDASTTCRISLGRDWFRSWSGASCLTTSFPAPGSMTGEPLIFQAFVTTGTAGSTDASESGGVPYVSDQVTLTVLPKISFAWTPAVLDYGSNHTLSIVPTGSLAPSGTPITVMVGSSISTASISATATVTKSIRLSGIGRRQIGAFYSDYPSLQAESVDVTVAPMFSRPKRKGYSAAPSSITLNANHVYTFEGEVRPGGLKKSDIQVYFQKKSGGTWGKPIPAVFTYAQRSGHADWTLTVKFSKPGTWRIWGRHARYNHGSKPWNYTNLTIKA